jgi:hypothetical protein
VEAAVPADKPPVAIIDATTATIAYRFLLSWCPV